MKRFVRWIFLAVALLAVAYAWTLWNQPHADFTAAEAEARLTSAELVASFSKGPSSWLNRAIEVEGKVASAALDHVILEGGVVCLWNDPQNDVEGLVGQTVLVHGRLVGFDELFGEARLDQCILR
jgi:hypothetical protein